MIHFKSLSLQHWFDWVISRVYSGAEGREKHLKSIQCSSVGDINIALSVSLHIKHSTKSDNSL